MATWMIEGEWSGYGSNAASANQRRVAHREYTTSRKFAEAVEALGFIQYTDGTTLGIRVTQRDRTSGKRLPVMRGYGKLIRDCVYGKTNKVADLIEG